MVDATADLLLIDDFSRTDFRSALGPTWRRITDTVMGGISQADLRYDCIDGRRCLRLTGAVRLENGGGFLQMSVDLSDSGDVLDVSGFDGIQLLVRGNGERYAVHLRTADTNRPWMSYRSQFYAHPSWQEIKLPFTHFTPHRLAIPMDLTTLKRLGLVAIGRKFYADLAVANVSLYSLKH